MGKQLKRNFEVEYSQSGMADALHRLNLSHSEAKELGEEEKRQVVEFLSEMAG